MTQLIFIFGKEGVGKSTLARRLITTSQGKVKALYEPLADYVRTEVALNLKDVNIVDMYGKKPPGVRDLLIGYTKYKRYTEGKHYWGNQLIKKIKLFNPEYAIVDDLRWFCEYDAITRHSDCITKITALVIGERAVFNGVGMGYQIGGLIRDMAARPNTSVHYLTQLQAYELNWSMFEAGWV